MALFKKSLVLRKIISRFVTYARANKKLRAFIKTINFRNDKWASVKSGTQYESLLKNHPVDFSSLIKSSLPRKVGIISDGEGQSAADFLAACGHLNIAGEIFDPFEHNFKERILTSNIDIFLIRPSHRTTNVRKMFAERTAVISPLLAYSYPSNLELDIYEAKRYFYDFVEVHSIPHPTTHIFYRQKEAIEFVQDVKFPLIFKTHNGASASGVEILYDRRQAKKLIDTCFKNYYLNKSITDYRDIDYGYIILQEYLPNVREFRIIKIGDYWMGHEKVAMLGTEFKSGSGDNLWTEPKIEILDFCAKISDQLNLTTMAFDIFETADGQYLVNELQTWFGSYNPAQMYKNSVPGALRKDNGKWVFYDGCYNQFGSMALRLVDAINTFDKISGNHTSVPPVSLDYRLK